jgi:nucleoid-associated protein YejK
MTPLRWWLLAGVVLLWAVALLVVIAARRFLWDDGNDSELARSLPSELRDQVREERRR